MELKDRIKSRRNALNLTLEEVAKAVGVGKATVQKWESGVIKNIGSDKIEKLAVTLRWTVTELMGWDEIQKLSNAHESLTGILKYVYDDVIINNDLPSDISETGVYGPTYILKKNNVTIKLDEIPYNTLFNTLCKIIPDCIQTIITNTSQQDIDKMLNLEILSEQELSFLEFYRKLDESEKGEIRGEMKYMIKSKRS